jgi:hypothetical protein
MTHKTVLSLFKDSSSMDSDSIIQQVKISSSHVTSGRYLVSVFDAPTNWDSRVPLEALVVSNTLGNIENRNSNWEYFGNGAIRCYKGKSLKLSKTLQWNIIKKIGDKPYKRRNEFSIAKTKQNTVPVKDPVFTRDVANNVWHLNEEHLIDRLIARFSSLLTWQDEDFVVVSGSKISKIDDRKKLVLKSDLVGVPSKVPYIWNSGDKLF